MTKQSDIALSPSTNQSQNQPLVSNVPEDQDLNQSDCNDLVFEFQPLEEFLDPVNEDNILTESKGASINKPTFYSPHSFRDNQELITQCCRALELGGRAFKRQLVKLTSDHFYRQLLNDIFPDESSNLNNLLINCNRVATTTGYAFLSDSLSALLNQKGSW